MEGAERSYDLNKLAELKYGRLPALEKELAEVEANNKNDKENVLLKEEVDEEDIAKVVSTWTGIPVSRLSGGDAKSSYILKISCISALSVRTMRLRLSAKLSFVPVPA